MYRKLFWFMATLLLLIFVISMLPTRVFGQTLPIGEPSHGIVRVPACDTPEQARDVMEHGKKGMKAFKQRMEHYGVPQDGKEPACGMVEAPILIIAVLATERIEDKDVTVFVFAVPEGRIFIGFTTMKVGYVGTEI